MFAAAPSLMLGLWRADKVEPKATAPGGGEICINADAPAAVDAIHEEWRGKGIEIAQAPTKMDFGYTFVALDPYGHRVRVLAPGA